MSSRKLQAQRSFASSSPAREPAQVSRFAPRGFAPPVQRYKIAEEPTRQQIYSVSDDDKMVTGMGTPNHELYVRYQGMVDKLNQAVKSSPLEFYVQSKETLFSQSYGRMGLRFKTRYALSAETAPKKGFLSFTDPPKEADAQTLYEKRVLPEITKFRGSLLSKKLQEISEQEGLAGHYKAIRRALKVTTRHLEMFKKLVMANQANEDYHDVMTGTVDAARGVIENLERVLYAKDVQVTSLEEMVEDLEHHAKMLRILQGDDGFLIRELVRLEKSLDPLIEALPKDVPVNFMDLQSLNFQEAQLEALSNPKDNIMLYRACDSVLSTLLGNKVTLENQEQIKTYAAGGNSGAFHYAAKVLSSGSDWVSLEGFAASDRDREVTGVNEEHMYKNLDNTWQYIMYGQAKDRSGRLEGEDKFFETYTKIRYYLKGIKEPGRFRTDARDKLRSGVREDSFENLYNRDKEKSAALFQRLVTNGVIDTMGRLVKKSYLDEEYIRLRLREEDKDKAGAVRTILKSAEETPWMSPLIQSSASSDNRNIAAWLDFMKKRQAAEDVGLTTDTALQEQDPGRVNWNTWSKLFRDMLK